MKNTILRLLFGDSFFFPLQVLVFVQRCSHLAAFCKCGWALIKNRKFQPSNLAELRFFFFFRLAVLYEWLLGNQGVKLPSL